VAAYDPQAEENARQFLPTIRYCADPYEVARDADALVLVTEWREFRNLDIQRLKEAMRSTIFLDGRNLYEPEELRAAGFTYLGIGRGYTPQPFAGDIDHELYLVPEPNGAGAATAGAVAL
jgi:UDPglucose 6-dehydrogenase